MADLKTTITPSPNGRSYKTNLLGSKGITEYRTDIVISIYRGNSLMDTYKADLHISDASVIFDMVDIAETTKSILYFSRFFNTNFEEDYLWRMLASNSSHQIHKSHLSDVYTAINNLRAQFVNFSSSGDTAALIATWKDLQKFLEGINVEDGLLKFILDSISGITTESLQEKLKNIFLSKQQDDRANGYITFLKGLYVGSNGFKAASGIADGYGGEFVEIEDEYGNKSTRIEVDYLKVRKKAQFTVLEIDEIKSVGGVIILSPAAMVCNRVVPMLLLEADITDSNRKYIESDIYYNPKNVAVPVYRCFFKKDDEEGTELMNQFVPGDQAICQSFNLGSGKDGAYSNVQNKYYWRLVVNTGKDFIDLSATDADGYNMVVGVDGNTAETAFIDSFNADRSNVPGPGDNIVLLGNRDNLDRSCAQIISAYGEVAPSHRMYRKLGMDVEESVNGEIVKSGRWSFLLKDEYSLEYGKTHAIVKPDGETVDRPGGMKQTVYGDWYVGTRDEWINNPEATYIKYDRFEKKLYIKGALIKMESGMDATLQRFRGEYDANQTYYTNDVVTYTVDGNVNLYIMRSVEPCSNIPPTDATRWQAMASSGVSYMLFKSTVFKWLKFGVSKPVIGTDENKYTDTAKKILNPNYGGTFDDPVPYGWSDGVETPTESDVALWMATRIFSTNAQYQQNAWKAGRASDTQSRDTEWNCLPGDGTTIQYPERTTPDDNAFTYGYRYVTSNGVPIDVQAVPSGGYCDAYGWMDEVKPEFAKYVLWKAERDIHNGAYTDQWNLTYIKGEKGDAGVSRFKSIVFKRSDTDQSNIRPTGGTYSSPIPTSPAGWNDGPPSGTGMLWMSTAWFASNSSADPVWSLPKRASDTYNLDVEYNDNENVSTPTKASPSDISTDGWYDIGDGTEGSSDLAKWMAMREVQNGEYVGSWSLCRIRGEQGESQYYLELEKLIANVCVGEDGILTGVSVLINTNVRMWYGSTQLKLKTISGSLDGVQSIPGVIIQNPTDVDGKYEKPFGVVISPSITPLPEQINTRITVQAYGKDNVIIQRDVIFSIVPIRGGRDGVTYSLQTNCDYVLFDNGEYKPDAVNAHVVMFSRNTVVEHAEDDGEMFYIIDDEQSEIPYDHQTSIIPNTNISQGSLRRFIDKVTFIFKIDSKEVLRRVIRIMKNGSDGNGYRFIYKVNTTKPETPAETSITEIPSGWTNSYSGEETNRVWRSAGIDDAKTRKTTWGIPELIFDPLGEPVNVYEGQWDSSKQYYGDESMQNVVWVEEVDNNVTMRKYYRAYRNAGRIPIDEGKNTYKPGTTQGNKYWAPIDSYQSLASMFLIAEEIVANYLTVAKLITDTIGHPRIEAQNDRLVAKNEDNLITASIHGGAFDAERIQHIGSIFYTDNGFANGVSTLNCATHGTAYNAVSPFGETETLDFFIPIATTQQFGPIEYTIANIRRDKSGFIEIPALAFDTMYKTGLSRPDAFGLEIELRINDISTGISCSLNYDSSNQYASYSAWTNPARIYIKKDTDNELKIAVRGHVTMRSGSDDVVRIELINYPATHIYNGVTYTGFRFTEAVPAVTELAQEGIRVMLSDTKYFSVTSFYSKDDNVSKDSIKLEAKYGENAFRIIDGKALVSMPRRIVDQTIGNDTTYPPVFRNAFPIFGIVKIISGTITQQFADDDNVTFKKTSTAVTLTKATYGFPSNAIVQITPIASLPVSVSYEFSTSFAPFVGDVRDNRYKTLNIYTSASVNGLSIIVYVP